MISPSQLPGMMEEAGGGICLYIAAPNFYAEIFDFLTNDLNISAEIIEPLNAPAVSGELLDVKRKFYAGADIANPIRAEAIQGALLLPDRITALRYLPRGGIAAEVGVAYGDFSERILALMKPAKFYAVDYFSQADPFAKFWGRDDFRRDNMPHQQWYERKFKKEIENGILETRQGLSWECMADFPDDYFDYVYLDAAHDFYSVKKDISVLINKVKDGGYIQFNDYCCGPLLAAWGYGVLANVNTFINNGSHKVKYFCLSPIGHYDIVTEVRKNIAKGR
ncbi:MAG: class I SAM-dependent methyltransferase [Gracilibacteraceae bacterium]|nr:class I SAM-dependent methyltransferase [Gracilibacteraceae bacterium]